MKTSFAQRYNFTLYGLKEGLVQSQIAAIYQDRNHLLWLGTFGGLSQFNGQEFTTYSKANGLESNTIHSITEDKNSNIILGTEGGLCILSAGEVEKTKFKEPVRQLVFDKDQNVWGISKNKLFKLVNKEVVFVDQDFAKEVTGLSLDAKGNVYISAYGRGIYRLKNNKWILWMPYAPKDKYIYVREILFDYKIEDKFYLLTSFGLYTGNKNGIEPYTKISAKNNPFYAIAQDNAGNLWVGTERGAYLVKPDSTIIHLNHKNGLSQNQVGKIFKDAENNIWIASEGEGLFKYEGDGFIWFDKFNGANYSVAISSIAADKNNNLWIGTYSNGIINYNGNSARYLSKSGFKNKKVFCLYQDIDKNVWMSVQGKGIWKYDGVALKQVVPIKTYEYTSLFVDKHKTLWYSTPYNCFYVRNGIENRISGFRGYISSLYQLNENTILLGTTKGVYLVKDFVFNENNRIKALDGINILAIKGHGNDVLFGTLGDGIISWNPKPMVYKNILRLMD